MKNTHPHNKLLAVVFIIIVIFSLWKIVDARKTANTPTETALPVQEMKTYQSDLLNFSIEIPNNWTLTELGLEVDFISPDGKLEISRLGTNFSDINGYISDLISKNKTNFIEQNQIIINSLNSVVGTIRYNNGDPNKKIYFIYSDYQVFTISTSSPELFDDLDTVAQSFRYTP